MAHDVTRGSPENTSALYTQIKRLGASLGLAKKAGKLACGTSHVTDNIRCGKAKLVLLASDISGRTEEHLKNSCKYYQTECINSTVDMETMSHFVGQISNVSAVAITDVSFAESVKKLIPAENKTTADSSAGITGNVIN